MFSRYLVATVVTVAFGAVYEWFSFGVYSYYMIYAFAVPLLGGVLPYYLMIRLSAAQENSGHNRITE